MNDKWYIDSLDAAGGLAFASFRVRDDDESLAYVDSSNTYFIGPPFFVPEPASRALALSARRGTFQTGFYIGNAEHPFEELSHVVEFVRRAYLGNDGTEGTPNTSPVPPPLPEVGGDRAPLETNGGPLADAFMHFHKLSVEDGSAATCTWIDWLRLESTGRAVTPINEVVSQSLESVAIELIARSSDSTPNRAARTVRSWNALRLIAHCVLPFNFYANALLDGVILSNAGTVNHWHGPYSDEGSSRFINPHEALCHLPLPRWLRDKLNVSGLHNVDTLAQLLSLVASSPAHIQPQDYRSVADMVLLGSAAIVSPATFGSQSSAGMTLPQAPQLMMVAMQRLTQNALSWCASSLPTLKFDDRIEMEIRAAAGLSAMKTPQSGTRDTQWMEPEERGGFAAT